MQPGQRDGGPSAAAKRLAAQAKPAVLAKKAKIQRVAVDPVVKLCLEDRLDEFVEQMHVVYEMRIVNGKMSLLRRNKETKFDGLYVQNFSFQGPRWLPPGVRVKPYVSETGFLMSHGMEPHMPSQWSAWGVRMTEGYDMNP